MSGKLPEISVVVRPVDSGQGIDVMDIQYVLDGFSIDRGDPLFLVSLETVGIPFCDMTQPIAQDDFGTLKLLPETKEDYPVQKQIWHAVRKSFGRITFGYRVTPRIVPDDYRSSPYFDFRNEEGGANGAGITFLAEVLSQEQAVMRFSWNFDSMPEGSQGVSAYGEGSFEIKGKPERLVQAYYAVGRINSMTNGDFGFYWFSDPPFDVKRIAGWTRDLYQRMASFFGDGSNLYRIFMRKDPFEKSGGGTALNHSYLFGYSHAMQPSLDTLKNMLSHEMVHNWGKIDDHPYGSATWYSEGVAEFYCVMLPYRFGLASPDETLKEIQKRTVQYFTSPYRNLTNQEAAAQSWQNRLVQRVPYGRGFFYLADLDVKIRQATHNKRSLDDVVLALAKRALRGEPVAAADFFRTVAETSGLHIGDAFGSIEQGTDLQPNPDSFDQLFHLEQITAEEQETCKDIVSWNWSLRQKPEDLA